METAPLLLTFDNVQPPPLHSNVLRLDENETTIIERSLASNHTMHGVKELFRCGSSSSSSSTADLLAALSCRYPSCVVWAESKDTLDRPFFMFSSD
jgi:hypothetical protein